MGSIAPAIQMAMKVKGMHEMIAPNSKVSGPSVGLQRMDRLLGKGQLTNAGKSMKKFGGPDWLAKLLG